VAERYADPARRYLLESRIATGGMGEVWRARDTVLNRDVAVKLLKEEYADDPAFRIRFETEARHAAALHHPGVAAVFDFGDATAEEAHHPYLVMELVDGQPLSALLRPGVLMPPEQASDLIGQAAAALGAAHEKGIVHRDVKPANLLVTPDKQVKVTDFGIARAADGLALTMTGQVMGTPQYLSPEQAQGATTSPASDVYSLGAVLFECLAGRRPFLGDSPVATALAHLREPVPDLPDSVPADLARVVQRCLAKDPQERFRDGRQLAAALRDPSAVAALPAAAAAAPATAVLAGGLPPARAAYAGDDEERRRGISPWWALVPVLLLLALVAWAWWQAQDPDPVADEPEPTPSSSAPQATRTTADDSVFLDAAACSGTVDDVAEHVRDLGLVPRREAEDNPGDEREGQVTGCSPTDTLERGETVTITYWGEAPEETPTPTESPTADETPTEATSAPQTTDDGLLTELPGGGDTNGNGNQRGRTE
jgi:tRNA A-37 threonylcarbamoyl transferase component Bud32